MRIPNTDRSTDGPNIFYRYLPFVVFFLLLSCMPLFNMAIAAPSPTSVSGNCNDNSTITITGTGFGNTGPKVVLFDDFESGKNGASIKSGAGSAKVGQWSSTEGNVTYSNATSVSGSLAFRADMADHWRNLVSANLPNGGNTSVFVSWWLYLPANDYYPGENTNNTNWKQMWIQGTGTTDDDLVFPTFNGRQAYFFGNDTCIGGSKSLYFGSWNFNKGSWHRYWGFIRGRADTSGSIYFYELDPSIGFSKLYENDNIRIQCSSGDKFESVDINGYGRSTPNSHPMFDDVYIAVGDYARARVEIGNRSSFEDCTKLTIATVTSWSDTQINATFHIGQFKSTETAYVFVFNSEGIVNPLGIPITIGSEMNNPPASSQPTDLKAPTGLHVVNTNP